MNRIWLLSALEAKKIGRDQFLTLIASIPVLLALLARFGIPAVRVWLLAVLDLAEHYAFIMSVLAMMTPAMFGWVIGFMLLDDKDEDILSYMAVTPLRRTGYLGFKTIVPAIFSFIYTYGILAVAGLTRMRPLQLLPVAAMAALETPIFALMLATLANNKVEGLAIAKLAGLVFVAPFVGYLISSPWAYIAGILPTFWISRSYLASGSQYMISIAVGLVIHAVYLHFLLQIFRRRNR